MKTVWVRAIKILALLSSIALTVLFLQNTLFYLLDENYDRLRGFYREPENSLDVVLVGASDVFNGFSPGYAYDYSGLTSYLYASAGNSGAAYLSQVKEVLSRQNPQLLLIEVHGFLADSDEAFYEEIALRRYVESIPLSKNKITTILRHGYDDPISCLFPFFKYHGQWMEDGEVLREHFLSRTQPDTAPSRLKGYGTNSIVCSMQPVYDVTENDETLALAPAAERHLVEFLEYLQNHVPTRVVFVRFPHQLLTEPAFERFLRSNRAEEIITGYGFDYLDLEQNITDTGLDYEYDFMGSDHLNFYGQMKMTEYLCDVMLEEYGLEPMPQTEENQQQWDEAVSYVYALQEYADEIAERGKDTYLYESTEVLRQLETRLVW